MRGKELEYRLTMRNQSEDACGVEAIGSVSDLELYVTIFCYRC